MPQCGAAALRAACPATPPAHAPRASRRRLAARAASPPAAAAADADAVPRVSAASLSPAEFAARYDGAPMSPLILTDVWPNLDHGAWLAQLVARLGRRRVVYQVQRAGETELFEAPLRDFLPEMVAESSHDAGHFLFDEECLGSAPELAPALPEALFEADGFDAFPTALRPAAACLLAGGAGARSSLHADPYAWTGWNYLLEGQKLWTFLPPSDELHVSLAAYRKAPNAWGDAHAGADVAAGWESAVDLYRHKRHGGTPPFAPSEPLPAHLLATALRCTQREGELLLIPACMWHQTYHTSPTLALAGQYLNSRNADGVFTHMLAWCGHAQPAALLAAPAFQALPLAERVRVVLREALAARHGAEGAEELLRRLEQQQEQPAARKPRRRRAKTGNS